MIKEAWRGQGHKQKGFSEKMLESGTDGEEELASLSEPQPLTCEMVVT